MRVIKPSKTKIPWRGWKNFSFCCNIIIIKRKGSRSQVQQQPTEKPLKGKPHIFFFLVSFSHRFIPNTKELVSAVDHHLMCRRL